VRPCRLRGRGSPARDRRIARNRRARSRQQTVRNRWRAGSGEAALARWLNSRLRPTPGQGRLQAPRTEPAGRRHGLLRRKNGQAIGRRAAGQVMGVDRMRDRLETEEVGLIGGRIEGVGRERRVGLNVKLQALLRPQNARMTVPAEKGVVDPTRGKDPRRHEVPLGTRGDRRFAGGQMILRLQHDALGFRLELRRCAAHDPGVKAETKRQRPYAQIAHGEPHGEGARGQRIARMSFVPERTGTLGPEGEFGAVGDRALVFPAAGKAVAVDWKRLAGRVRSERVELPLEMKSAAGNAIGPRDQQVVRQIERSRARRIAARAEQGRSPARPDKVIGGETRAQIRNDDGLGDAVMDCEGVRNPHAVSHPWIALSS
jgi:hypothetical protein